MLGHGRVESQGLVQHGRDKEKSQVIEKGVAAGSQLTPPHPPRPVWETEGKGCYILGAYKDRRETKSGGEAAIPSQFLKVSGRQPSGGVRRPARAGYIGLHT